MTDMTLHQRIEKWKDLFWLGSTIAVVSLPLLAVLGTVLWAGVIALYGEQLRSNVRDWTGLTEITETLDEITGADRIIHEEPDMSYVREPIYSGDKLTLVLFMGRTDRGADCRFLGATPLYTDDYGVTMSGPAIQPIRQIEKTTSRLELELEVPSRLNPGHAIVQLQLEYDCDGRVFFEMTTPEPFLLLKRS